MRSGRDGTWPWARHAWLIGVVLAVVPPPFTSAADPRDPWRPAYHFTPPAGWMNDPNGLVQVQGTYHLFYQHHPFGVDWGPMHWGHATSTDLVHWRREPIALAPSPDGPDAGGVFSGSAIDDGGVLSLVYTGHGPAQVQCLATSRDGGRTFQKHPGNPVIAGPPPGFAPADFRDPKVWRAEGRFWLVAGTKRDGKGQALLYESPDLRRWTFKAVLGVSDGTGGMWECPDLVPLGDRHLLFVSPNEGVDRPKVFAITGHLDYATGVFRQEAHRLADFGFDFYAPQSFADAAGRRVLIGWMENWARKTWPTKEYGWAGAMTIPRVVALRADGVPTYTPIRELEALRHDPVAVPAREIAPGSWPLERPEGDALELVVELRRGTGRALGLSVLRSADGRQETRIVYDAEAGTLAVDRERAGAGDAGVDAAPLPLKEGETLRLRVFVDRSSVEVFAQDGSVVLTERVFPDPSSRGVALIAEGGTARLVSLQAWRMAEGR